MDMNRESVLDRERNEDRRVQVECEGINRL